MTQTEFTLTVTVRGNSLQDIDKALADAAGERIMARLKEPVAVKTVGNTLDRGSVLHKNTEISGAQKVVLGGPSTTSNPPATVTTAAPVSTTVTAGTVSGKRPRGRPKKDHLAEIQVAQVALEKEESEYEPGVDETESSGEIETGNTVAKPRVEARESAQTRQAPPSGPTEGSPKTNATPEEAAEMLKSVNLALGFDAARGCLKHFGVERCRELPADKLVDFMRFCEKLIDQKV